MEGPARLDLKGTGKIDRLPEDIEDPSKQALSHRYIQGLPPIADAVPTAQPTGGGKGYRPDCAGIQVGADLQD